MVATYPALNEEIWGEMEEDLDVGDINDDDGHDDDDDDEENRDEQVDTLSDLRAMETLGSLSAPQSRSYLPSNLSTPTGTFVSAKTHQSRASKLGIASYGTSYFSTSPFSQALSREVPMRPKARTQDVPRGPMSLGTSSDYMKILAQNGLLPTIEAELNWSGRKPGTGQHVEFEPYEEIPLKNEGLIFCSPTARIERVRCKRILLARKSMTCHKKMGLPDAMNEVKHLNKLRHSHIVQLVGTYIQGKTFAVLLYPVADLDLKDFLQQVENILVPRRTTDYGDFMAIASLGHFFSCLAAALAYVHSQTTKHLDIKPRNVLVKRSRDTLFGYQVYLADFGISRSFSPLDHSQTDSHVGRTAKYCAPEVYEDQKHGRAADVFSLGCVFLEMQSVLCRRSLEDLDDVLQNSPPLFTFHANLNHVISWIEDLIKHRPVFVAPSQEVLQQEVFAKYPFEGVAETGKQGSITRRHMSLCSLIRVMLHEDPDLRPKVTQIVRLLDKHECCDKGREPFRGEMIAPSERIDPSTELHRVFKGRNQNSIVEREDMFCRIVESGNRQLTESFLRHFSAFHLSLSESTKIAALRIAFFNDDIELLKTLTQTFDSKTLLEKILTENVANLTVETVESLINSSRSTPPRSHDLGYLLPEAAGSGRTDLVQYLLHCEFDSSNVDIYVKQAVKRAVLLGKLGILDLLLYHNRRAQESINEEALLSNAILSRHYRIAAYLLMRGGDPRISRHSQAQSGRTALHDAASLANSSTAELLHLSRLMIMVHDCRDTIAFAKYDRTPDQIELFQGTPLQVLSRQHTRDEDYRYSTSANEDITRNGWTDKKRELYNAWMDLLMDSTPATLSDEDSSGLEVGIQDSQLLFLNNFADRWERYKRTLTSRLKIQNIVCLDIGARPAAGSSEGNCAYLFIAQQILQMFAPNKRPDLQIFLDDNIGPLYAEHLGLSSDDGRIVFKRNLTQFAGINTQSLVISLDPRFAARQAFADLLPMVERSPLAIICERVQKPKDGFQSLMPFTDPVSQEVLDFFKSYTAHDLMNTGVGPSLEGISALNNLTLYLRASRRRWVEG